jgi:hypothetical protein
MLQKKKKNKLADVGTLWCTVLALLDCSLSLCGSRLVGCRVCTPRQVPDRKQKPALKCTWHGLYLLFNVNVHSAPVTRHSPRVGIDSQCIRFLAGKATRSAFSSGTSWICVSRGYYAIAHDVILLSYPLKQTTLWP